MEWGSQGFSMKLEACDGRAPQNAALDESGDIDAIFDALSHWPFDRVELVATSDIPPRFLDRICKFAVPYDIAFAEPIDSPGWPPASGAAERSAGSRWRRAIASADRVTGVDALSRAFCRKFAGGLENPSDLPAAATRARVPTAPQLLAVVYPFQTADSLSLLLALSAKARRLDASMIVLGSTPCDEKLRADGIFVTGPTDPDERPRLLDIFGADRLLLPYRREGFWALECLLEEQMRAASYFDWSGAGFRLQDDDLALDASWSDDAAAEAIMTWLGAPQCSGRAAAVREVA
jgi:hypothetical protein